jgi:hypothetical protein
VSERTATFDFEGSVTLRESDIWPDKDAPRDWTAEDVVKLMKRRWLHDWNMEDDITTTVTADDGSRAETRML